MKKRFVLSFGVVVFAILALAGCKNPGTDPVDPPTVINIAAIQGLAIPATGRTPVKAITANAQYSGTVTWSPNHSTFAASTVYTATITLTAKETYTLQGVKADFFKVSGATATNSANSGVVKAVFLQTGGTVTAPAVINAAAIEGVTVPASGGTPVTAITDNTQYSGSVTWSPNHATFAASTVYTATITLTAKEGYTLQGVAANFFEVSGAILTSNNTNSGSITAVFPATAPINSNTDPINISSVNISIIAPVKGATPITTASAGGGGNFTVGAVSWSPNDNPFLGNTVYTATVTLTANSGYTFDGLSSTTINGQSVALSNNTGSAVTLSHTFPATNTKAVTDMAIKTQPSNLNYTHGDTLDLAGLAVTLTHDDTTTEEVAAANFAANNITANPAQGSNLTYPTHNSKPVTITYGTLTCNTNNLTVNRIAPTAADFTVSGTGSFYYDGSTKTVSVTPKEGKSTGARTIKYNGSTTAPSAVGEYAVTFDVAAAGDFSAANGLSAGTLMINPFTSIAELNTYLRGRPANTAATPYTVALNVTGFGGSDLYDESFGTIILQDHNRTKYVNIDLSGSTITEIPASAIILKAYKPVNIVSITLPDSVTSIGREAFIGCVGLTSVTIPNSVTSIADSAFYGCVSLTAITVDAGNTAYCSQDGVLYNKDKSTLLAYPIGKTGSIFTIPNSVTTIGSFAFSGFYHKDSNPIYIYNSLTNVTIPDSVKSIGRYAFSDCRSLTSVNIPNGVTSIEDYTFYNCYSLTGITIPNSVKSIGGCAFSGAFEKVYLRYDPVHVTIPNSVTSIGISAFNASITVTIGNSVTSSPYLN